MEQTKWWKTTEAELPVGIWITGLFDNYEYFSSPERMPMIKVAGSGDIWAVKLNFIDGLPTVMRLNFPPVQWRF